MFKLDPLAQPEQLIQRVYAYVAYRMGEGPEAEDVTSDVFERAMRYRSSYDSRKGPPVAWLLGIARHCISEEYRRRSREDVSLGDVAAGWDLETDTLERLEVRAAVGRLDERDRELIALRYGADLRAREIGELLGERTNTVEVALHRALGRLRASLDGTPEAPDAPEPQSEPVEREA